MRVLLDHSLPFSLAHGGLGLQIQQTSGALKAIGVDVDWMRWWDEQQKADVIQFFGRPHPEYIRFAQQKGIKVVMLELLTGLGSRSAGQRMLQRLVMQGARLMVPKSLLSRMAWDAYRMADAIVANTSWERELMIRMFDAPPERVHVVPNAVEDVFLQPRSLPRDKWLVCTATITERKRVLELARVAVAAGTPLWIIGRPYSEQDPYHREFTAFASEHRDVIRYEGGIGDRDQLAGVYAQARGFVLWSTMETSSFSALEAAACGCPLLLADLPWARSVYGNEAKYVDAKAPSAPQLREFYDSAPQLKPPTRPPGWLDIARQLRGIYESA